MIARLLAWLRAPSYPAHCPECGTATVRANAPTDWICPHCDEGKPLDSWMDRQYAGRVG